MYYVNLTVGLLTPLALLAVGIFWKLKPPTREGSGLAYRTPLSERTQETWVFAHKHISRLWIRLGVVLSIATVILVHFLVKENFTMLLWVMAGQMAFLCLSAFFVDILLKGAFDEDGRPL